MRDLSSVLASLKPFQRKTVEHVYRRMYEDSSPAMKFLIADEVGLGKTLVAKGVVAKAIDKMERDGEIRRIDVIYVCSNAAIARQNINRLNLTGSKDVALASRLTLLPYFLKDLGTRKINFLSFTPGTTFNLKSSTGVWQERVLIYRMLRSMPGFDTPGFMEMLRCYAAIKYWPESCASEKKEYDSLTASDFRHEVFSDPLLCSRIEACSSGFLPVRENHDEPLVVERNYLVSSLRLILAKVCVSRLEPDLVILDEFQRFRELLHGESDAALLARDLMNFVDPVSGTHARVLMLSATPYRMYTLSSEEENHYEDFLDTLGFLFDDDVKLSRVKRLLESYRNTLVSGIASEDETISIQAELRELLMSVMVRTERVGFTSDRNSMLVEEKVDSTLTVDDLYHAKGAGVLSALLEAGNVIEYWKSAPYLLNFMKGYVLKNSFEKLLEVPDEKSLAAFREYMPYLLSEESVNAYEPIDPGNPRLRSLVESSVDSGLWKLLWLPPSMPYYDSAGAYSSGLSPTKSLVFSSWNVVPDAIASICSYEAERRMVRSSNSEVSYSELHQKVKQFLRFPVVEGKPASMTSLVSLYPCPFLSATVDPLSISLGSDGSISASDALGRVRESLAPYIDDLCSVANPSNRHDLSWYWAVLARLDRDYSSNLSQWCSRKRSGWKESCSHSDRESEGLGEHVDLFAEAFLDSFGLESVPEDLIDVVAEVALGSPAVCAARALRRIAPSLEWNCPALMNAAAKVANGFRSMFNNPDSQLLLRNIYEDVPLWRAAIRYGIDGNLQAVLDEYAHVLKESLGLFGHDDSEVVEKISETMSDSLSLRVSNLTVDQLGIDETGPAITRDTFKMRCRFALRFADLKGEKDTVIHRAGAVREAFNSPFRPFVLASTSIGQEGLDFHTYCHEVWHWNLPSNPIDLEQREGRVHRYKGHAVRKNIALKYGIEFLRSHWDETVEDPWEQLFRIAEDSLQENCCGIIPYWIFEDLPDAFKVKRVIPMIPFSREESVLERLKRTLALYRLAFGQPRQEEMLEILKVSIEGAVKSNLSLQP